MFGPLCYALGRKAGDRMEIIVALIGAAGSGLGAVLGVVASAKLTQYRIGQLEIKVDKHNNLIERTFQLEKKETLLEEKIAVANHRIDDLERLEDKVCNL